MDESYWQKNPDVRFIGTRHGEDLARYYAAADVFVFPSRTDTFGLVMIEALACGVSVTGPLDVINGSGAGLLDHNLKTAVEKALLIDPAVCVSFARNFSWEQSARSFLKNLHLLEKP